MGAERPGIVPIQETRLEGVSFADALAQFAQNKGIDSSCVPVGDRRFFESVLVWEISEDDKHALALAQDGKTLFLIRDGIPVLSGEYRAIELEKVTDDYTRAIVRIKTFEGQQLHLVTEDKSFCLNEKPVKRVFLHRADEDLTTALVSFWEKGKTVFGGYRLTGEAPVETELFSVKGQVDGIAVLGHDTETNKIVWVGGKGDDRFLFINGELVNSGDDLAIDRVSPDLSRVFSVAYRGDRCRIVLNSRVLLEGRFDIRPLGQDSLWLNKDLSVVVTAFNDNRQGRTHQLLILDGNTYGLTKPFDELLGVEITEDKVVAQVWVAQVKKEWVYGIGDMESSEDMQMQAKADTRGSSKRRFLRLPPVFRSRTLS